MLYEELRPAGAAAFLAESYWRFSFDANDPDHVMHRIVPDGLIALSAVLAGSDVVALMAHGASTTAAVVPIEKGLRFAGIRLLPGVARGMLRTELGALAGPPQPLAKLAPHLSGWAERTFVSAFAEDGPARLDAALGELDCAVDTVVRGAADALLAADGARLQIAQLAASAQLSPRRFRERFAREAGIGPKAFAQVRRQRAAWIAIVTGEAATLADASYTAGFADQPHFSRAAQKSFALRPSSVQAYVSGIRHRFG